MIIGILLVVVIFQLFSIQDTLKKNAKDPVLVSDRVKKLYKDLQPHIGKEINIEINDFYPIDYNYTIGGDIKMKLLRVDPSYAELSYMTKNKESVILVRLSNINSLKSVVYQNLES